MEHKDIDSLKMRDTILGLVSQGFKFPFNEFFEISHNIEVYRFGHDVNSAGFKNHETTYEREYQNSSKPYPADILYCCALSCYASKESAELRLKSIMKRHKKRQLKIGNGLLHGVLAIGDGYISELDEFTHFDFYQKACCDMYSKFKFLEIISPTGDFNDGTN
ncbi:hypothetical protein [Methanolapillus millepedarum]